MKYLKLALTVAFHVPLKQASIDLQNFFFLLFDLLCGGRKFWLDVTNFKMKTIYVGITESAKAFKQGVYVNAH